MASDSDREEMKKYGINPYSSDAMKRLEEARKDNKSKSSSMLNDTQNISQNSGAGNLSSEDKKKLKTMAKKQLAGSQDYMQQRWQNSTGYQNLQSRDKAYFDNQRMMQQQKDMQAREDAKKMQELQKETAKKIADVEKKADNKVNDVKKEEAKALNQDKKMQQAGKFIPEGGQAASMFGNLKERWDRRQALKKEEAIADRRAKNEDKIMKKQRELMNRQYKNSRTKEENYSAIILLFLLAILAHILDWMNGWPRPPNMAILVLWIFIVIAHFFFISDKSFDGEQNTLMAVVALTVILPIIIDLLLSTVQNDFIIKLGIVLIAFPPLVLYFMFKFPAGAWLGRIYLFIWVFIVALLLITSPAAKEATSDAQERFSQSEAKLSILSMYKSSKQGFEDMISGFSESLNKGIKYATGQEYEGDEESRVGIFLEDVRPIEQEFYTSSNIYIQGTIRAENIKELVPIRTSCHVADTNISGKTYPERINMLDRDENYIDCELGRFTAGSFEAKMTAQFTFMTEAKINYYFIDAARKPESYTKTKIPQKSTAIYTGGPVELGLPSLNQPLRIGVDGNNRNVGDYPFGISLKNKWTEGKIVRGINYTLDVPDSVELYTCNRKWVGNPVTNNGRKIYVFKIDNNNLKETFDSVTCRMRVIDSKKVLGEDIERAPEITFKGTATYDYAIEKSAYINVINDGITTT